LVIWISEPIEMFQVKTRFSIGEEAQAPKQKLGDLDLRADRDVPSEDSFCRVGEKDARRIGAVLQLRDVRRNRTLSDRADELKVCCHDHLVGDHIGNAEPELPRNG
jgi:hypothetical protein